MYLHNSSWKKSNLACKGGVDNLEIDFLFQKRQMAKTIALLSPQWFLALACGCLELSEEKQRNIWRQWELHLVNIFSNILPVIIIMMMVFKSYILAESSDA